MQSFSIVLLLAMVAVAFSATTPIAAINFPFFKGNKVMMDRTVADDTYKFIIHKGALAVDGCDALDIVANGVDYTISSNEVDITAILDTASVAPGDEFAICYLNDIADVASKTRFPDGSADLIQRPAEVVPAIDYVTNTLTLTFTAGKVAKDDTVTFQMNHGFLLESNVYTLKNVLTDVAKIEFPEDGATGFSVVPSGVSVHLPFIPTSGTIVDVVVTNHNTEKYQLNDANWTLDATKFWDTSVVKSTPFNRMHGMYMSLVTPTTPIINIPVPQLNDNLLTGTTSAILYRTCESAGLTCLISVAADYDEDIFTVEISDKGKLATITAKKPFVTLPEFAFTLRNEGVDVGADQFLLKGPADITFKTMLSTNHNDNIIHTSMAQMYLPNTEAERPVIVGDDFVNATGLGYNISGSSGFIKFPYCQGVTYTDLKMVVGDVAVDEITLSETSFTFAGGLDVADELKVPKYIRWTLESGITKTVTGVSATVTADPMYKFDADDYEKKFTGNETLIFKSTFDQHVPYEPTAGDITVPTEADTDLQKIKFSTGLDTTDNVIKITYGSTIEAAYEMSPVTVTKKDTPTEGGFIENINIGVAGKLIACTWNFGNNNHLGGIKCNEVTIVGAAVSLETAVVDPKTAGNEILTLTFENSSVKVPSTDIAINGLTDEKYLISASRDDHTTLAAHIKNQTCFQCTFSWVNGTTVVPIVMKDDADTTITNFTKYPTSTIASFISTSNTVAAKIPGYVNVSVSKTRMNGTIDDDSMDNEMFSKIFGENFKMAVKTTACGSTNAGLDQVPAFNSAYQYGFAAEVVPATTYNICYCYGSDECGTAGTFTTAPAAKTYPTNVESVSTVGTDVNPADTIFTMTLDKKIPVGTIVRGHLMPKADGCDASKLEILSVTGDKTVTIDAFGIGSTESRMCIKFDEETPIACDDTKTIKLTKQFTGVFSKDSTNNSLKLELSAVLPGGGPLSCSYPAGTLGYAVANMTVASELVIADAMDAGSEIATTLKMNNIIHPGFTSTTAIQRVIMPSAGAFTCSFGGNDVSKFFVPEGALSLTAVIKDLLSPIATNELAPNDPSDTKRFAVTGDKSALAGVDGPTVKKIANILIPPTPSLILESVKAIEPAAVIKRECFVTGGFTCAMSEFDTDATKNGAITLATVCNLAGCTFGVSDTQPDFAIAINDGGNQIALTEEMNLTINTTVSDGNSKVIDDTVIDVTSMTLLPKNYKVSFAPVITDLTKITSGLSGDITVNVSVSRPIADGKTVKFTGIAVEGAKVTITPTELTFGPSDITKSIVISHNVDTPLESITAFTIGGVESDDASFSTGFAAIPEAVTLFALSAVVKPVVPKKDPEDDGLSTLAIVGIAAGVILVVGAIVLLIVMKGKGGGKAKTSKVKPMNKKSVKSTESVEFAEA